MIELKGVIAILMFIIAVACYIQKSIMQYIATILSTEEVQKDYRAFVATLTFLAEFHETFKCWAPDATAYSKLLSSDRSRLIHLAWFMRESYVNTNRSTYLRDKYPFLGSQEDENENSEGESLMHVDPTPETLFLPDNTHHIHEYISDVCHGVMLQTSSGWFAALFAATPKYREAIVTALQPSKEAVDSRYLKSDGPSIALKHLVTFHRCSPTLGWFHELRSRNFTLTGMSTGKSV
jgi:hypothetical protein